MVVEPLLPGPSADEPRSEWTGRDSPLQSAIRVGVLRRAGAASTAVSWSRHVASNTASSSKTPCPPTDLETLRGECQRFVDERDHEVTRLGVDRLDLCHRGRRDFVHAYDKSPAVERFLLARLGRRCG